MWKGIQAHTLDFVGTEHQVKEWARRQGEGAQVLDPNGYVRYVKVDGRLKHI
jgi:hypothetical protein